MGDDVNLDPFVRAALEAAAWPTREWSTPELMRRLDYILAGAAKQVGLPYGGGYDFEGFAGAIVAAAQAGGKLDPCEYRRVFGIWSVFPQHSGSRDG
jgi:hypothetical protein